MKFIVNIRALLIGLWLGAACFFSFAVSPSAFGVLPSRELAGNVVSRTLTIINLSGIAFGSILLLLTLIKRLDLKPLWLWTERFLLLIVVAACAAGQFVISAWLSIIRAQAGKPMEEVALDDPLRIQFDQLHQYSIWALMTAMIASLLVFFIISSKSGGGAAKKASKDFDFQNEFIN
jgi:small-conductance mechanosensitive channel